MIMAQKALLVLANLTRKVRAFTHVLGNCDACIDAWTFAPIECKI